LQPEVASDEYTGERIEQRDVAQPQQLLAKLAEWKAGPSLVIAKDLNSLLNRANTAPMIARLLKDLNAQMMGTGDDAELAQLIVVDTEESQYPCGYQKASMPLPDRKELSTILDEILDSVEDSDAKDVDEEARQRLLNAVSGLPAYQASNAFAESLSRTGRFDAKVVAEYKKVLVQAKGLEIIDPDPRGLDCIGGMEPVKEYIVECEDVFDAELAAEYDLTAPKGVIISSPPGCGKSALAKGLASHWGFVLIRADLGTARGMYQGQSEEGTDNILKTAEAVAPCVLWIDEVEKAMSGAGQGGQTDGGTGDRILGKFLTFMQETDKPVFMFFTANRPDQLPSEFTRAGRLDKQFWASYPNKAARKAILGVFSKKYRKASDIDVDAIVAASDGYTGAELEVAIKGALRTALSQRAEAVTTEMVLTKLEKVTKVSETFEMTGEMQKWADAADKADAPETETETKKSGGRRIRRAAQ
jgi:SpoVK/Ycf46/Vps4 family AAA+-type ATPase